MTVLFGIFYNIFCFQFSCFLHLHLLVLVLFIELRDQRVNQHVLIEYSLQCLANVSPQGKIAKVPETEKKNYRIIFGFHCLARLRHSLYVFYYYEIQEIKLRRMFL